jgi:uncharacterized RDD family membrane protein YckC
VSTAELGTRGIVTPEAVVLEFEPARLGTRSLQMGLDFVIQMAVLLVVFFGIGLAASGFDSLSAAAIIIVTVAAFVVILGYPIGMEAMFQGRTVGMMASGLRVVTVEGAPIRFRHAAIRGFLMLIDFWACTGLIGAVTMLCNRNSQRLGDLAAGTMVLRERTAARTDSPVAFLPPAGWEPYAASLDTGRMTERQYGLVRSFLLRVAELSPEARAEVAHRLADPIARSMNHTPPQHVTPEAFLICVAAAYQRLHAGGDPAWGPEGPLGPYRPLGIPGTHWGGPSYPGGLGGVPTAPPPQAPQADPAWPGPADADRFPGPQGTSFTTRP